jgi:competence protein ComEA
MRSASARAVPPASDPTPVDLNPADAEQLDTLPGIGPVLAGRILEFRRAHGPFRTLEELRAVRGVGPRLLERLAPRVRLGHAAQDPDEAGLATDSDSTR